MYTAYFKKPVSLYFKCIFAENQLKGIVFFSDFIVIIHIYILSFATCFVTLLQSIQIISYHFTFTVRIL